MKVVLDSNIIVSAFAGRGLCHSLFELCLDRYDIIISEYILSEVYRILHKKMKLSEDKVKIIDKFLKEFCTLSSYNELSDTVCRDKNDNNIIALTYSNSVTYLITGDNDLLTLKKYKSVKIISPRDFWSLARNDHAPL
jgi:putative PIN family toxin of toxin-antitoxin system